MVRGTSTEYEYRVHRTRYLYEYKVRCTYIVLCTMCTCTRYLQKVHRTSYSYIVHSCQLLPCSRDIVLLCTLYIVHVHVHRTRTLYIVYISIVRCTNQQSSGTIDMYLVRGTRYVVAANTLHEQLYNVIKGYFCTDVPCTMYYVQGTMYMYINVHRSSTMYIVHVHSSPTIFFMYDVRCTCTH